MSRLNIELPDEYSNVFNMLKISNSLEIKSLFKTTSQVTTFQFILLEFVKKRNMKQYIDMLESPNLNNINTNDNTNNLVSGEVI